MSKYERKAAKIISKGVVYSTLGVPPGSEYAAKKLGRYAGRKIIYKIKEANPITK